MSDKAQEKRTRQIQKASDANLIETVLAWRTSDDGDIPIEDLHEAIDYYIINYRVLHEEDAPGVDFGWNFPDDEGYSSHFAATAGNKAEELIQSVLSSEPVKVMLSGLKQIWGEVKQ